MVPFRAEIGWSSTGADLPGGARSVLCYEGPRPPVKRNSSLITYSYSFYREAKKANKLPCRRDLLDFTEYTTTAIDTLVA